jgi:phage FluMu protein Com
MIKFNCKNCGQKVAVHNSSAGKKGKCPKCKTIIIVPKPIEPVSLKINDTKSKNLRLRQQSPEPELHLQKEPPATTRYEGLSADGLNVTDQYLQPETEEKPPERRLPWIIDIFLYPTSTSGLINLGIFWLLPILLSFTGIILPIPFVWPILSLIIAGYFYYYLMECIRDSSSGQIRAPENIGNMPDMSDAVTQFFEIIASIVIFWGPLGAYLIYKVCWVAAAAHTPYDPMPDTRFWLLFAYGFFFFPMGILALAMFDSISAFNPLLWITSIFSTFFQYCSMLLFFAAIGWLISNILSSLNRSIFITFLLGAVFIYLAMVAAHILGRFYYINAKKLNWEM